MPIESRWILQPIDGEFVRALWASGSWFGRIDDGSDEDKEVSAAYFYEDRGRQSSHIRAIREDGLQAWQWPAATGELATVSGERLRSERLLPRTRPRENATNPALAVRHLGASLNTTPQPIPFPPQLRSPPKRVVP